MLQSGMAISPSMLLAVCLCSALTLGGIVFVAHENFLTTALGTMIGFAAPVLVAMIGLYDADERMVSVAHLGLKSRPLAVAIFTS